MRKQQIATSMLTSSDFGRNGSTRRAMFMRQMAQALHLVLP